MSTITVRTVVLNGDTLVNVTDDLTLDGKGRYRGLLFGNGKARMLADLISTDEGISKLRAILTPYATPAVATPEAKAPIPAPVQAPAPAAVLPKPIPAPAPTVPAPAATTPAPAPAVADQTVSLRGHTYAKTPTGWKHWCVPKGRKAHWKTVPADDRRINDLNAALTNPAPITPPAAIAPAIAHVATPIRMPGGDVFATATVDGVEIILRDNGTWSFADVAQVA